MKIQTSLILTVLLIFICCIGAASAADDISDDSLAIDDEAVVAEQVVDGDLQSDESGDTTLEANNAENNELLSSSGTATVSNWTDLKTKAETVGTDYTINLASGTTFTFGNQISFKNSATIIGTSDSYISGSRYIIPFICEDNNLDITFKNVNFKGITCTMLIKMNATHTILDNCSFENINAMMWGKNSVVYNNEGTMDVTDCTFKNCKGAFGVITNHNDNSVTNIILNVNNSKFENNYGYTAPGAINNCGILTVYNSTFVGNSAYRWAGAIHTHSNASTFINKSTFKSNVAGWNGGALFTYSNLTVYNSVFEDNNCSETTGGGAIGSYNFESQYNIIINNCTFKKNNNVNGNGGAIATLNGGYLNVYNSTFIDNYASNGLAICAANENVENGTNDQPYLAIEGNKFINHTGSSNTVVITGNISSYLNNTFTNSIQTIDYTTSNEDDLILSNSNELLGAVYEEILSSERVTHTYDTIDGLYSDLQYPAEYMTLILNCNFENFMMPLEYWVSISNNYQFDFIGSNSNTLFDLAADDCYDLDSGSVSNILAEGKGTTEYVSSKTLTILHTNLVFMDPVKVGNKNFKFINCTFTEDFEITDKNNLKNPINVTFENCEFEKGFKTVETANVKINAKNTKLSVSNESNVIIVKLTDADGNPIKGATVNYNTTTGVKESNTTGEEGTFKIYGLTGEFTINATYAGNESYNPSNNTASFNFKLPAVETTLNINSTEKGIVTITVKDAEGKPVANAEIKYNNGGENTTKTTNNEGIVTVSGLTGEGEIKAYFEGNENYLKSEGLYKYNFTETTPAGNGTSGNGTSGNGTSTNPAGNGTSGNGTSTNPAGNGTSGNGTSTNTGKTTTNTPKVTKKATKITAKKATFKAKKKTKKYTIVLKAGKAAVKKVKVTLKVGKKTYKATTNSKGKATFKITKLNKKGKYTAVIKFAGNKNFKPTSKKVKITVKK